MWPSSWFFYCHVTVSDWSFHCYVTLSGWSFYCHVTLTIGHFIVMWSWAFINLLSCDLECWKCFYFLFFRELIETMLIFYTSLMTKSLTRHVFSLPLFDVLHHLLCVVSKQESYDLPLLQHGLQCLLHVTAKTRYMYMYMYICITNNCSFNPWIARSILLYSWFFFADIKICSKRKLFY